MRSVTPIDERVRPFDVRTLSVLELVHHKEALCYFNIEPLFQLLSFQEQAKRNPTPIQPTPRWA